MPDETPITELTELEAVKVSGVGSPANGTPWLLLKAADTDSESAAKADGDKVNCGTCDGTGKIMEGNRDCPDCENGKVAAGSDAAEKSDSAEADAQEDEMTGEASKADPTSPAASDGPTDAVKGEVQDSLGGTDTPHASGTVITSTSGVAGPATGGVKPDGQDTETGSGLPGVTGPLQGGESAYVIPAESRINGPAVKHAAITLTASSLAEAIAKIDQARQTEGVAEKADGDTAVTDPGSMPWESLDSVTLQQVAQTLAHCGAAIDAIQDREALEAMSGDPSDWCDSWDLYEAQQALDFALGIAARLAFVEQAAAQAAKGAPDFEQLTAAQDKLTRTLSAGEQALKASDTAGSTPSQEDSMAIEVTKEELAEAIIAGTESAVEAHMDAFKSELGDLVAEAVKNANNGGDISAADIKANGQVDDRLGGVPDGGNVDSQFVNKSLAEQLGEVVKSAVAEETAGLKELVAKMGKRPRQGGPVLGGQVLADLARTDTVAKSGEELEIEALRKQLADTSDPFARADIGERLTLAQLRKESAGRFGTGNPLGQQPTA